MQLWILDFLGDEETGRIQKERSSIQTKIWSFTWVSRHNTFIKMKQNSKQTNFSKSIYNNMYVFS